MVNLKATPKLERPREKLLKYGVEKLSNEELLALLLRTGTKEQNVLKLAQKILQKFEGDRVLNVSVVDLLSIHGIGTTKAAEIAACFELGKRLIANKQSIILLSPKDVWEQMVDIRSSKKEHFVAFYLDTRNQEIKREIISIGTLNESLVHPREVFEGAIKNNAAAIIIAHNHPSGSIEASEDDIEITKRLIQAGRLLDIRVLLHVIVTSKMYGIVEISD